MRSFRSATLSFTTFVLLILTFCGLPLSNAAGCQSELDCDFGLTRLVSVREVTPTPTWQPFRRITNAERLARGLPLNPPTRRRCMCSSDYLSLDLLIFSQMMPITPHPRPRPRLFP